MKYCNYSYIWQETAWPQWSYDHVRLQGLLAKVHRAQGELFGRLHHVGWPLRDMTELKTITEDVLKTSEIEGQILNPDSVRSSVALRLGVDIGALAPADRHVDGVVEMILDATQNFSQALTSKRLHTWHQGMFPDGYSGLRKITVGRWRDDAQGAMRVVSGPDYRQQIHFEAPSAELLDSMMSHFLDWFNTDDQHDPVIKAGLAHLWFVTIHPYEDGNGRIARAINDMLLARSDNSAQRYYSLSAQIQYERNDYYEKLEATQKAYLTTTDWLEWYLSCLLRALQNAQSHLAGALQKASFWQYWSHISFNQRQVKILNRLLDGFVGKLTTSKWAAITKCSADTALRDITELLDQGVLTRSSSSGRSTSYDLSPLK